MLNDQRVISLKNTENGFGPTMVSKFHQIDLKVGHLKLIIIFSTENTIMLP